MVRLLHTADPHLGLTRYSKLGTTSRADDFCETLIRFADTAIEKKVDLAVIAGDTFHGRKPVPRDLDALTKVESKLSAAGITLIVSEGNHDGKDVVGDPRSAALGFLTHVQPRGVYILTRQVAQAITTLSGVRLNLVSTPYPHKNSFDAVLPDEDLESRIEAISRSLEAGISALIEKVQIENPDLPTIFVGHLSVLGAAIGTEVTMRFGWDVAVRSGVFDPIEYAALGHIHRQQQIGQKAWYAGSPEYMDFGEINQPKGFLLVEAEKGADPKVEVIDSKPRTMASIEATWTADDSWVLSGDIPKESILRVTATTTVFTPPSEIAALARLLRGKGASYFKIDYQKPDSPVVGKPAIDRSADAVEALRVWLVANKHEVEPALSLGAAVLRSVSESHDLEEA